MKGKTFPVTQASLGREGPGASLTPVEKRPSSLHAMLEGETGSDPGMRLSTQRECEG